MMPQPGLMAQSSTIVCTQDHPLSENIFDILLRFRASRIALTGYVERAFLMLGITEEDRDVLRFL